MNKWINKLKNEDQLVKSVMNRVQCKEAVMG